MHSDYIDRRRLGGGSQGETFVATHRASGRRVVQKVVRLTGGGNGVKDIELWERECKTLATLDHPAIPKYLGHYTQELPDGDKAFVLVQSFVEGNNLSEVIASGRRWTEDEWVHLARQLLHILGYLHELNPPVIHRDVKPSNIILQANDRLALIDFGGVQSVVQEPMGGSTVVGTHGYMPPEQLVGRASPASDLYGMAATLVHLASGIAPSTLPMDRMQLQFRNVVHLSARIEDWLGRLLAPMVEDRPKSARQALADFEAALRPLPSSASPTVTPHSVRPPVLNPKRMRLAHYAIIALLLGAGFYGSMVKNKDGLSTSSTTESEVTDTEPTTQKSQGMIPITLVGSAGLKLRINYSHIQAMGLSNAYYSSTSQVTWTGSAAFTITHVYISLFDKEGQELDRFDGRTTSMGASLQPGDSITISVSTKPTVLGAAVRAELHIGGRQAAAIKGPGTPIHAVRWPEQSQFSDASPAQIDALKKGTSFFVRGRENGVLSYRKSWIDVAVARTGDGPALDWFEFRIRAVAPSKETRCRSLPGYPVNSGEASFQPGQTRVLRASCRQLHAHDTIEVDVTKVRFAK